MRTPRRLTRRSVVFGAALLPLAARAQSGAASLPRIDDLRPLLTAVAHEKRPLLLFFTTPGCPYCREVRRSYLQPRIEEGAASGVTLREVDILSARALIDETGKSTSESAFAARFDVRVVPYVQLADAALRPLGKPLIGLDSAGFYDSYLQAAIDAARRQLAAR